MLSLLDQQTWTRLSSLRDALLEALQPPLPADAPREAHLERARALALLLALDGPGAPSLEAGRWLGPLESAGSQGMVLQALAQRPEPPPLPLLRESWQRWMDVIARDTTGWWVSALCALLGLLWRAGGPDEARRALEALPLPALDRLVAGGAGLDRALQDLLYERWSSGPQREALSWRQAVYATLDRPASRRWILEAPEPIDEGLWLQGVRGLGWGPDAVVAFFEGAPERLAEMRDRLLLPVPVLAKLLDPAVWSERLLQVFQQAKLARQARQDKLASWQGQEGDTVQILVTERVKGGYAALVTPREGGACAQGFLPASQAEDAVEIGASYLAKVLSLPRGRASVVVSRRAWLALGEPEHCDERATACLQAAQTSGDPAFLPPWTAPFSEARALRLIAGWEALAPVRQALLEDHPPLRDPPPEPAQRPEALQRAVLGELEALLALDEASLEEAALALARSGRPEVLLVLLRVALRRGAHALGEAWTELRARFP